MKVVKTRGAEEFWFCAELELAAESRGLHAAREAMAAAELAPSKDSADLRVRRGLRVTFGPEPACGRESVCGRKFAVAESCVQQCFMATSFISSGLGYRIDSYRAGSSELIERVFGYRAVDCRVGSPTGFSPYCIPKS